MIGGCCVNTLAYGGYSNDYCDVICHFFAYGPHNDDRALIEPTSDIPKYEKLQILCYPLLPTRKQSGLYQLIRLSNSN